MEEKRVRLRLRDEEAEFLGLAIKPKPKGNGRPRYHLSDENKQALKEFRETPNPREFVEVQYKLNKQGEIVSTVEKLQSKPIQTPDNHEIIRVSTNTTSGQQWVITKPITEPTAESLEKEIDFDSILSKHIKSKPPKIGEVKPTKYVDRLIYSDTHIGMTTNENGFSLYGGKWDEKEQEQRFKKMIDKVLEHKRSNIIYVDDLADFMDGWDGQTTRKGHDLPQNMDNEKAFDTGLRLKIMLTDALSHHYEKVICNNVCNDNHAGAFGYVINSAFKSVCEHKYSNVEVINSRRFISHYTIGKHCIILCHGKDSKSLKFGFKPHLDPKQIEKISEYIRVNKIMEDYIEFSKGDSHQLLLDYSGSDLFDYFNYGALSPSSEWVQTNFKQGRSSFVMQHINPKDNEKIVKPFYFDWNE